MRGILTWASSLPTIVQSAIVSILVAGITSWLTSWVRDTTKARLAAEQRNLAILIGARLKEYPVLYSLLSDIPKAFDLWQQLNSTRPPS
jgi:hypothetical protein